MLTVDGLVIGDTSPSNSLISHPSFVFIFLISLNYLKLPNISKVLTWVSHYWPSSSGIYCFISQIVSVLLNYKEASDREGSPILDKTLHFHIPIKLKF